MHSALDHARMWRTKMIRELEPGKFPAGSPILQFGIIIFHYELAPFRLKPMIDRSVPTVVGVRHHDEAQVNPPRQLYGVTMRVVPYREPLARDEASVERERYMIRPPHGRSVAAEPGLRIDAGNEVVAAGLDRALPVSKSLLATLPGEDVAFQKLEIVVLVIDDCFAPAEACFHELGRRDMVKLVGIESKEPVAITHSLSRAIKQIPANAGIREEDRLFSERLDPLFGLRQVVDNFPGVINAPGVKYVDLVGPGKGVPQGLTNNVRLVAAGKKGKESHTFV